jgi:glycerol uptake facilitator protein
LSATTQVVSPPEAAAASRAASVVAYPSLPLAMGAEMLGTFVLVFFGVGAVNAAVITGAQSGLWQVAVVWAVGVSLGIYSSAAVSGAHLNPAIT